MIPPDDRRHGSHAGYGAGCHNQCCRDGTARYQRGRGYDNLRGIHRTVPIVGAQRRIQALHRLGWSSSELSRMLGRSRDFLRLTLTRNETGVIHRTTHEAIVALYDQMSMRLAPDTHYTRRTAAHAEEQGWLPPLAWDDELIDDPHHDPARRRSPSPKGTRRPRAYTSVRDDVDEAVVLRVLAGEHLDTTPAERVEIVRRWMASGRSEADLCRITGWRTSRYTDRDAAAS